MSVEEIRWWLLELLRRRGWGTRVLGRTMGLRNPQCVMAKADGRQWIYRGEQIRMSHQLRRIISGEFVCINGKPGRGNAGMAVIADHPQPLRLPIQWHINLKRKDPFEWRAQEPPPPPMLPNFRNMALHPRVRGGPEEWNQRPKRLREKYYGWVKEPPGGFSQADPRRPARCLSETASAKYQREWRRRIKERELREAE
jgi:hypothetical protein